VLVTGDALHGWTPYMGESYPYDWIHTLDAAEKLDFQHVIGGHSDVIEGKETFELARLLTLASAIKCRYLTESLGVSNQCSYSKSLTVSRALSTMSFNSGMSSDGVKL
jgi:glyoxylase-like metal-dependent hydrolase (beta-lactamase superfamily II)